MKDILSLVQTAVIKLYIEANESEKIEAFFDQFSESSGMRGLLFLKEEELKQQFEHPTYQSKDITHLTMALLFEATE